MDEKVLGQISIYETLYKSHMSNPLSRPIPHTTLDAYIQNFLGLNIV